MFNKFKQKIADGVEGVSAGRQTPLRSALRGNEGGTSTPPPPATRTATPIERNENLDYSATDSSLLLNNSFSHPLDEKYTTPTPSPLENTHEDEPSRNSSALGTGTPPSFFNSRQRRTSNSSTRSNSSVQDDRGSFVDSDAETGVRIEHFSFNELRELYTKQDKSLRKYKLKFSELVDAYKGLQKDKEKLEGTLTTGQDKQLRKMQELRETIELEQESKRHLEESLRMDMGEKDDQIDVLKTQVSLLKGSKPGLSSPMKDAHAREMGTEIIQSLQDKVQLLTAEIETLTSDNDAAHALVSRSEQEKKTAIEGVMNNMHDLLNEQEDLRSQLNVLTDELKHRDVTIMKMRSEEASNEDRLRKEFMCEMQETVVAKALQQQEAELQVVFEEKGSKLKSLFAEKVQELHQLMEENENKKQMSLQQKESHIVGKDDEILILKEQVNECKEKEADVKTRLQKLVSEKETNDIKYTKCQLQLEEEKEKRVGIVARHEKEAKAKLEEHNEQMSKVKSKCAGKVNEVQEQLRKKTNEFNDVTKKHEIEVETKVKEASQSQQAEHAKASRKLDVKMNEMKKIIKELRQKLSEKEGECTELESNLQDAKTEVDQSKTVNSSLAESEQKVGQLNCSMEVMAEQVAEWSKKYELLDTSYNELSVENKGLEEQLFEKDLCIKELVQKLNNLGNIEEKYRCACDDLEVEKTNCVEITSERDDVRRAMQQMTRKTKEEENALQSELNNLKTKLSFVEDELQELTQQLHNKVREIELLVETLDNVNKQLTSKDTHLEEKRTSVDELNDKLTSLTHEKQRMEYTHNEVVLELQESNNTIQCKLKEEFQLKVQKKDEELQNTLNKLLRDKDSSLEDVTSQLEDLHKQQLAEIRSQYEQKINKIQNDLQFKTEKKHNEFVRQYEEEKARLISDGEKMSKTINDYKGQMETMERKKCDHYNELTSKHTEDRNILLAQIEEKTFSLNELRLLCAEKDGEFRSLAEKVESESAQYNCDMQTKLEERENAWKDKHTSLEKKFKKIINDRDKKNKTSVEEMQTKHAEEIASLQTAIASKEVEVTENTDLVTTLKQKVEGGSTRLKEASERYENELGSLRARESEAWTRFEQCKTEMTSSTHEYEAKLNTFQTNALEDKSVIEKLNMKMMSCESSSKDIDSKISQLLGEKSELEQQLVNNEQMFEDKIRHLENENNSLKSSHHEHIRKLQDEAGEQTKSFQEQKCEILSKHSEADEASNGKLADLKKKAEMKISKLKKENNEKVNELESARTQLQEQVVVLRTQLEEEQKQNEEQNMFNSEEYEQNLSTSLQEYENTIKSVSEKFNVEMLTMKDDLLIKSEKVEQLEELLDNSTVDKMDALKTQKSDLDDEHETALNKITVDNKKEMDALEKKLTAKIEEKDFLHNSEVKAMLKQFQIQMGSKDMEIQQAIQEASELAQKDERQIICEYDQQIVELQKEMRLREKDMLALQNETQEQFDVLHGEREVAGKEHEEEVNTLKVDYHKRLEDLSKRHEEALQNINSNKNACIEEEKAKVNEQVVEMEQKYMGKIQQLEDNHRCDMLAQERKYRSQLKHSKNEMRKLLANQGVIIQNSSGEHDYIASDNELDQVESVKFKSDQAPSTPRITLNDRPATLQLSHTHTDGVLSPPKSPQPLEFEYLRNILFNYMIGKQRKQMAKVLTAICHFTPSQVQQVLATVEAQESSASHAEKKSSSWF